MYGGGPGWYRTSESDAFLRRQKERKKTEKGSWGKQSFINETNCFHSSVTFQKLLSNSIGTFGNFDLELK